MAKNVIQVFFLDRLLLENDTKWILEHFQQYNQVYIW